MILTLGVIACSLLQYLYKYRNGLNVSSIKPSESFSCLTMIRLTDTNLMLPPFPHHLPRFTSNAANFM